MVSSANNSTITGAISGSPSVSGNLITVTLVGSVLKPKQIYTLVVTFNTTALKVLQSKTIVNTVI